MSSTPTSALTLTTGHRHKAQLRGQVQSHPGGGGGGTQLKSIQSAPFTTHTLKTVSTLFLWQQEVRGQRAWSCGWRVAGLNPSLRQMLCCVLLRQKCFISNEPDGISQLRKTFLFLNSVPDIGTRHRYHIGTTSSLCLHPDPGNHFYFSLTPFFFYIFPG